MGTLKHITRLVVALVLSMAFAFALFLSTTALGRPIGPVETAEVWTLTGLLGWATFRRWEQLRASRSP
jgi:hypothetical protein